MKKNWISKFFSIFDGVIREYLREFSKKFEMVLTWYSGAWGTLIYEKKSRVRLPLSIFNTKIGTKLSKIWSGMFFPDPDFFSSRILESAIKKALDPESWIQTRITA